MDVLKAEDVARLLQVSRQWVYRHTTELGGFRIGDRLLRFHRAKIDDYLARQKQPEAATPMLERAAQPKVYRVS